MHCLCLVKMQSLQTHTVAKAQLGYTYTFPQSHTLTPVIDRNHIPRPQQRIEEVPQQLHEQEVQQQQLHDQADQLHDQQIQEQQQHHEQRQQQRPHQHAEQQSPRPHKRYQQSQHKNMPPISMSNKEYIDIRNLPLKTGTLSECVWSSSSNLSTREITS